jgi:serine protease Do
MRDIYQKKNYISARLIFISAVFVILVFTASLLPDVLSYDELTAQDIELSEQEATVRAIKRVMPAVVNINVYDREQTVTLDLQTGESTRQEERIQKSEGSGVIISDNGYIITNKHVIDSARDATAEYRVILDSGQEYYAQLISRDPLYDIAVLKIFDKNLPTVELGDSDALEPGMSVIAIGNALGRYQNTVTKGIVSGLGRSVPVTDIAGRPQALDNVIQTDAGINPGNSGGPLVDLRGRVVGINTAIDSSGEAIGFAIPINDIRPIIQSIRAEDRVVRPQLGVRYIMLTPKIANDNGLGRTSGAWITSTDGSPAVVPDSPAAEAGLQENDIIFEINAIPVMRESTLLSIIQKYRPGDRIGMKVQRGEKIIIQEVVLGEFSGN